MSKWLRKTSRLFGLSLALLACAAAASCDTIALSVSPPLVEMTVAQGGDRSFQVTLTNDGDKMFRATAQVVDLILDRHGNPVPRPAGADPWSVASWVSLSKREIALGPGEQKTVRCRLRVPRGQAGGRYGAVLFTAQREAELGGSGMRLETRTGTLLMVTVARTERRSADIGEVQARSGEDGSAVFAAELKNTGNVHFRASGELIVREATGRIVWRTKMAGGTGTVLPDGLREFAARWDGQRAPPGACRAEVRFRAPGLRSVRKEIEFTFPLVKDVQAGASGDSSTVEAGEEAG